MSNICKYHPLPSSSVQRSGDRGSRNSKEIPEFYLLLIILANKILEPLAHEHSE